MESPTATNRPVALIPVTGRRRPRGRARRVAMVAVRQELQAEPSALARLTAPGAPFEIHTEDVLGVPMPVFANRHRSLGELLHASTAFGEREYLVTAERTITFSQHHAAVAALAAALRDRYGIGTGDRVALCSANNPDWIVTFWAVVSLGAVAVGMNSLWAAPELRFALELMAPAVLVADTPRRALAGDPGIPVLDIEREVPALVSRYHGEPLRTADVAEDDPAVVLFTSGTTGRPKGVTHSHRNLIAACWFHLCNDAVAAELGRRQHGRRFLLVTPLFHIAALHNLAVVRLAVGDTAVLHLGRFDAERVLRLIESEHVTNWGAVPTMLSRILRHGDLAAYDLSSLLTVSVNSAPSSPELKERLRAALPQAGRALATSYGLTESSTAATVASPDELRHDPDTVGKPVPTMAVEVCDAAGNRVPDGTEGEVWLRGPLVMLGYWRDPDATDAAITPDRWLRTGDLGTMTGGRLRISGRRSDLIIRGGENVYPAEVEGRLTTHPAVLECIVLGRDDPDLGEQVGAVVVVPEGEPVTAEQLREYTAARLARYKVPTRWRITTTKLPRNATGKVDRTRIERP